MPDRNALLGVGAGVELELELATKGPGGPSGPRLVAFALRKQSPQFPHLAAKDVV